MAGAVRAPAARSPPRDACRATTWWGKAWVRAVEESAYAEADLRAARALARGRTGRPDRHRAGPVRRLGRGRARPVDGRREPAGARRGRLLDRWSRPWPRRPAGSRRCSPATCRTPWSSTPTSPAWSCCPSAASSARAAPATTGPTRARTRWRCSTSWPGWSRPTRSCCSSCGAASRRAARPAARPPGAGGRRADRRSRRRRGGSGRRGRGRAVGRQGPRRPRRRAARWRGGAGLSGDGSPA